MSPRPPQGPSPSADKDGRANERFVTSGETEVGGRGRKEGNIERKGRGKRMRQRQWRTYTVYGRKECAEEEKAKRRRKKEAREQAHATRPHFLGLVTFRRENGEEMTKKAISIFLHPPSETK